VFLWGIEIWLIISRLNQKTNEKHGFYGELLPFYGELKLLVFRITMVHLVYLGN
jgi:hypothetical protein